MHGMESFTILVLYLTNFSCLPQLLCRISHIYENPFELTLSREEHILFSVLSCSKSTGKKKLFEIK